MGSLGKKSGLGGEGQIAEKTNLLLGKSREVKKNPRDVARETLKEGRL